LEILFKTNKLQKACNSLASCQKKWGSDCGKRLMQRLDDMHAANCLADTIMLPGNFHPLRENRAGQWSAHLVHPLRLIFKPANEPLPKLDNDSLDATRVTMVRILEVIDYHD